MKRRTGLSEYPITFMNGLGVVATGRRSIYTGSKWDAFYPDTSNVKEEQIGFGDSYLTLAQMADKIRETHQDAAKIANELYSPSLEAFTRNIFDHIYQNFQYFLDPNNREQVKGVRGSYANRVTGIDCDDMAFLAGAILYIKGIPFALRKIALDATGDFSHVYVVVPKKPGLSLNNRSNYWTIDPVLDRWDYEYPKNAIPKYFHDHLITPKTTAMNGLGCDCQMSGLDQYNFDTKEGWEAFSINLKNGTEPAPEGESVDTAMYKAAMILLYWDNSEMREAIISELIAEEEKSPLNGLNGGFLKKAIKGVAKGVTAVGKGIATGAKAVAQTAVNVAQKVATVMPITVLAREGVKLWFKHLARDKAAALWPGIYTPEQAAALGITESDYKKRAEKWVEVRKIYNTIGGDVDRLAGAIHDGAKDKIGDKPWYLPFDTVWYKKPIPGKPLVQLPSLPYRPNIPALTIYPGKVITPVNQVSVIPRTFIPASSISSYKPALKGLGEPVTITAAVASAAPFIAKLTELLAGVNETVETVNSVTEVKKQVADLLPKETKQAINAAVTNTKQEANKLVNTANTIQNQANALKNEATKTVNTVTTTSTALQQTIKDKAQKEKVEKVIQKEEPEYADYEIIEDKPSGNTGMVIGALLLSAVLVGIAYSSRNKKTLSGPEPALRKPKRTTSTKKKTPKRHTVNI